MFRSILLHYKGKCKGRKKVAEIYTAWLRKIYKDERKIVNYPNTTHKKNQLSMTPVKYNFDYSFLIDSGQVFYHVKYLIRG